jgi:hypothetical protein
VGEFPRLIFWCVEEPAWLHVVIRGAVFSLLSEERY